MVLKFSFPPSFFPRDLLATVYDDPYDVDLFVGHLLEKPFGEGLVGKTATCLIGERFLN